MYAGHAFSKTFRGIQIDDFRALMREAQQPGAWKEDAGYDLLGLGGLDILR